MSPWIWSGRVDLAVFALPTLVGGLVLTLAPPGRGTHDLSWVVLVLAVDVAHVWATLFRTYLDPDELRRRPATYVLVPLACLGAGVLLHSVSAALFWRVLAYLAVVHFIRQQAGWAAIYRARAGERGRIDRVVDAAAIYLGTGVPLLHWHTQPRPFAWFMEGDFVDLARLAPLLPAADALLGAAVLAFVLRQLVRVGRGERPSAGKAVLVGSTVISWWLAIVVADGDLAFTALNVLPHGVPYFALLYAYARARARVAPTTPGSRVVLLGAGPFVGVLVALAFVEEAMWDRLVWHDRGALFGFLPTLDTRVLARFVVPLLALPQATHYALDALLWRRKDAGPAQAEAMGFGRALSSPPE